MIPFLHLGVSYYVSPQIVGIFCIGVLILLSGVNRREFNLTMICSLLFLIKAAFVFQFAATHDFLLVLRELFCFAILVIAIPSIVRLYNRGAIASLYVFFLLVSAVLVIVQYIAISNGKFVSFPYDWFVMNTGTLEGVDTALEFESRLRPTGFYGEPSYMAFILVSLFVIFLSYEERWKQISLVIFLNSVIFALLSSLAGILAFLIICVVFSCLKILHGKEKRTLVNLLLGLAFILLIIGIILYNKEFISRLNSVLVYNEIDPSIYVRYHVPISMFMDMIKNNLWFGYSGSMIYEQLDVFGIGSVDNALLYLLLHYGVMSTFLILSAIIYYLRHYPLLIAYILLTLNFNGSFFSYDKSVIMALVLGLSVGAYKQKNDDKTSINKNPINVAQSSSYIFNYQREYT